MLAIIFPKRLIAHPVLKKGSLRFVKFFKLQNNNFIYFSQLNITMTSGKLSNNKEFL